MMTNEQAKLFRYAELLRQKRPENHKAPTNAAIMPVVAKHRRERTPGQKRYPDKLANCPG